MSIWRGNQRRNRPLAFDRLLTRHGHRKPSGHGVHSSQQGVLSEGGIIVESDGLAQRGFDRANTASMTEWSQLRSFRRA